MGSSEEKFVELTCENCGWQESFDINTPSGVNNIQFYQGSDCPECEAYAWMEDEL